MKHLRSLTAVALLSLLLIGTPMALALWGVPPTSLLTWAVDDGRALLAVMTLFGWIAWATLSVSVLAEVTNVVAGRRLINIPLLGGVQSAVAVLVLTAFSATASGALVSAEPPVRPPGHDALTSLMSSASDRSAGHATYLVTAGDDLWTVAERLLGDGHQWRQLVDANPELRSDPTQPLSVGVRLVVPKAAEPRAKSEPQRITVVAGDTLSELAETHLGKASAWPRLQAANRGLVKDPDLIQVGWKLILPASSGAPSPQPERDRPTRRAAPASTGGSQEIAPPTPGRVMTPDVPDARSPAAVAPSPNSSGPSVETAGSPGQLSTQVGPVETASVTVSPETRDLSLPLIGGITGIAAAFVLSGVAVRRQAQLRARDLGRRVPHPDADTRRYQVALGRRVAANQARLLERALRYLGGYFRSNRRVPRLRLLTLSDDGLLFAWTADAGPPPPPFDGDLLSWRISAEAAAQLPDSTGPVPFPAIVTVGRNEAGDCLLVDLEQRETLSVLGEGGLVEGAMAGLALELACSTWANELELTVVQGDLGFVAAACPEGTVLADDPAEALARVRLACSPRGTSAAVGAELRLARLDPDTSEAARARVFLFAEPLPPAVLDEVLDLVDGAERGLAIVLAGAAPVWTSVSLSGHEEVAAGSLAPDELDFVAQVIPEHTRRAIAGISAASDLPATQIAPWWSAAGEGDNVRPLARRLQVAEGPGGDAPVARSIEILPSSRRSPMPDGVRFSPVPQGTLLSPVPQGVAADPVSAGVRVHPLLAGVEAQAASAEVGAHPSLAGVAAGRVSESEVPAVSPEGRRSVAVNEPIARHPQLRLLGPIELIDARGLEPSRARRQCEEYCGWLLEHPRATATQMTGELLVAEGTRRSNMSRLRTWLGSTDAGTAYLPEAYSGRISLDPLVTSDWQQVQLLLGPGANRVAPETLIAVLDLVRGAPLADAAPGQWFWAEELRTDMSSAIRDVGVVLARHARLNHDLDLARWAAARALVVAPEDELLVCERIRTEHRAGNRAEVERLVLRLTQQARILGVDLADDTVRACQEAMEGRVRARA